MTTNGDGLTIQQILDAEDITIQKVTTPTWGGHVYVRNIDADRRDTFDERFSGGGGWVGMRRELVGLCLCNQRGEFFNPSEAETIALGKKSSAELDRVFGVCQQLNGMLDSDIEKLEGNLERADESDSG